MALLDGGRQPEHALVLLLLLLLRNHCCSHCSCRVVLLWWLGAPLGRVAGLPGVGEGARVHHHQLLGREGWRDGGMEGWREGKAREGRRAAATQQVGGGSGEKRTDTCKRVERASM